MSVPKNDIGEIVSGFPSLRKPEYGTGEYYSGDKRRPRPNYEAWLQYADSKGFDKRIIDDSGNYITEIVLPKGTHLIRYGSEAGKYTAPKGTNYNQLSLPWEKHTCEYHEYVVIADGISVMCIVTKGSVAPGFECAGGGIQYYHQQTIKKCKDAKLLAEVELWK